MADYRSDAGESDIAEGVYNIALRKNRDYPPGYTGHIHKQRETFGTTFANGTRVALQCPPDSPEPMTHWDMSRGQRTMQTPGFSLPGSGFTAVAKPSDSNKANRVYVQGSKVDLQEYYKALEACDYEQILIKSGSAKKARSYMKQGDNFYYSGPHMFETTYMESYEEEPRLMAVQTEKGKSSLEASSKEGCASDVDRDEATFRYRCIQAVVGEKRLNDLEEQIRSKVMGRMSGGAGELLKSFKLFSSGKGEIGPNQLQAVVQDLGIDMSKREAFALFGRFDINKDGGIVYYEFIDSLLKAGGENARDESYYDK